MHVYHLSKAVQSETLPCSGRSGQMVYANAGHGAQTPATAPSTGKTWRCEESYIFPMHIRNKYFRNTFVTRSNGKHASYNAQAIYSRNLTINIQAAQINSNQYTANNQHSTNTGGVSGAQIWSTYRNLILFPNILAIPVEVRTRQKDGNELLALHICIEEMERMHATMKHRHHTTNSKPYTPSNQQQTSDNQQPTLKNKLTEPTHADRPEPTHGTHPRNPPTGAALLRFASSAFHRQATINNKQSTINNQQ